MNENSYFTHPLIIAFKAQGVSDADLTQFLRIIDESSYSLDEWREAWAIFETWCQNQKRGLTTQQKFEYISCCAESARAGVALPLAFLLSEFLRTNGVE
jgi:hypothetical protein